MTRAEYLSRLRGGVRAVLLLGAVALVVFPLVVALFLAGLAGIVLLIAGLLSWLHPVDVAAAWARTLAGIGLIGGAAGLLALLWLVIGAMARGETSMQHKLKFGAVIGILLALICLPFGVAIGANTHVSWFGWGDDTEDSGRIVTRDFPWNGGDRLVLDVAGHVRFHPAPTWHLTIRGREGTLDRLRVSDGSIREEDDGFSFFGFFDWHHHESVQIDLSGPALRRATLNGSGSIDLQGLRQDSLRVEIHGSGWARGSGNVQSLKLGIMGSGSARLAQLAATDVEVTIDGSGDADISPTGVTEVTIAGSGDVRLHSHPSQLNTHVYGSGRISEVPGTSPAAVAPPPPASGA
jgi:Putative auto-transporter adhesin, head GIN domain